MRIIYEEKRCFSLKTEQMGEMMSFIKAIAVSIILGSASYLHAQCTKDVDCKGDRICVDGKCVDSHQPNAAAPALENKSKTGSPGWGIGAGVTGFVLSPVMLGLGIGSAVVNNAPDGDGLPLGVSALSVAVAALPVVAIGGASSRSDGNAKGILGLRIAGYSGYGLAIADGIILIITAIASDDDISSGAILSTAIIASSSCILLSTDALVSGIQAKRTLSINSRSGTAYLSLAPCKKGMGLRLTYNL
jgi:hypothetical protein